MLPESALVWGSYIAACQHDLGPYAQYELSLVTPCRATIQH